MLDILSIIPGKKKVTQGGWHSFNAVCCHHRGHRPDKRQRAGIKFVDEHNWNMNCFNCGFRCGFSLGRTITRNTRQLLLWCGIDESQINRWNLESLQQRDLLEVIQHKKRKKAKVKFKEMPLPEAELLDYSDLRHKKYSDYVKSRKVSNYPILVTPNETGRNSNRVIIPFTYNNIVVGHTSRFLDDRKPKFISEQQSGYVFGYDLQKPDWSFCVVVEGIFDALSISGCALTGADISDTQAQILMNLNRKIIVVPDQDSTGLKIIDKALQYGFYVSLPEWNAKDVNEAVIKYGKVATLLSIIQSATNNKIKIEMKRKKLERV